MSRTRQIALGIVLLLVLAVIPTGATLLEIIDKIGLARLVWTVAPFVLLPLAFWYLYRLIEAPRDAARPTRPSSPPDREHRDGETTRSAMH